MEANSIDKSYLKDLKWKYEVLIRARNFHYENFNKWMTYFYVMIGALFLGLCYIISKAGNYGELYEQEIIILSLLGFIISLFWHWANKGYYYWNINFITLVNYYESDLLKFKETERVYYAFANKGVQNNYINPISGANISTSKISLLLSYVISLFWLSLFFYFLVKDCFIDECRWLVYTTPIVFSVFTILLLSISFGKHALYSKHDHFPDLEIKSTK